MLNSALFIKVGTELSKIGELNIKGLSVRSRLEHLLYVNLYVGGYSSTRSRQFKILIVLEVTIGIPESFFFFKTDCSRPDTSLSGSNAFG